MKIGQDNIDNQAEYDDEYYDEEEYDDEEYDDDEYDDEYDDDDEDYEDEGSPYPKWLIYSGIGVGVVVLLIIVRLVTGGGSASPKDDFLKRLNDSVKSEYAMKYNLQISDMKLPKSMKKESKKLDDTVSFKGNLNTNGKNTSLTISSNGLEELLKQELDAELVVIGDDIYAKGVFGAKEDEYINLASNTKTKSTAKAKENVNTDKIQKQIQNKLGDFFKNYDEKKFVKDGDNISLNLSKSDVKKIIDMSLDASIENSKGSTKKDFESKKKSIDKAWDDVSTANATITLSKDKQIVITTTIKAEDFHFNIKFTGNMSDYKNVKTPKVKESNKSDNTDTSKDKSSVDLQSQPSSSDSSASADTQGSDTANSDESPAIKDLREYLTNDADGFTDEDAKTVDRQKQVEQQQKQAE